MTKPLVSVIITTKNEEKNIGNCLESVKNQTYRHLETIVVDNSSTDKTKEIALQYTKQVFNKGPERSAQRNFGIKKSKGKYAVYLDADIMIDPNVVQECVKTIESDDSLVALYLTERMVSRPVVDFSKPVSEYQDTYWIKVRDLEKSFHNGTVIDCVRFVKRTAFDAAGGFDETMSGPEDWDFDKKIRKIGKVDIVKNQMYHNERKFDIKEYLAKKAYYSKSFDKYIAKWGKDDPDVRKQLGIAYRMFGAFTENGKWKRIVRNPIKFTGLLYLKALVGLIFLMSGGDSDTRK